MKYFWLTFCVTLLLASTVCNSCDIEEFRTCYLNAETEAEEEICLQMPDCEQVAEDFRNPLEIDVPMDDAY